LSTRENISRFYARPFSHRSEETYDETIVSLIRLLAVDNRGGKWEIRLVGRYGNRTANRNPKKDLRTMSITLKAGTKVFGAACLTEGIVVRAPKDPIELRIGGHPALTSAADRNADLTLVEGHDAGALMGKRYTDADDTLELLCTKAGKGGFAVGEVLCEVKGAKALPASD
jgi:hypothetical protein